MQLELNDDASNSPLNSPSVSEKLIGEVLQSAGQYAFLPRPSRSIDLSTDDRGSGSPLSSDDSLIPKHKDNTDKSPKDAPRFAPVIPDSMLLPKGFLDRPNPEHFKVGERKPPLSDEQLIEKGKECLKDWVYTPRFDRKNIELYEDELKRLKKLDPETAKELDDSIQRRKYGFIG
ncbi:MAG: hypothetical protein K2W95_33135 [Candidatus Obscuribacterales bacterium]|nr:hypothetical protein [Candidatus Obscuribacterales bacterium]